MRAYPNSATRLRAGTRVTLQLQLLRPLSSHAKPFRVAHRPFGVVASSVAESAQDTEPLPGALTKEHAEPSPGSAFEELGVDPILVDGLLELKITRPSPIQGAALPVALSGRNCAIQSYTGSGKTLSYLLPVMTLALQRANAAAMDPATPRHGGAPDIPIQVLVVTPSQELAMQVMRVAKSLMPPESRRQAVQQVIGGANSRRQAEALVEVPGPLVVVGTPGRLSEMIRTGALRLHQCPIMVLDEADQLLAPAFAEDINHISEHCGKRLTWQQTGAAAAAAAAAARSAGVGQGQVHAGAGASGRQTLLVSATMTPTVMSKAARWCPSPTFVSAGAAPTLDPELAAAKQQGGAQSPAWGWGVRGWDGPASPLAPKTIGSAGGVESSELVPTMPPQLLHYYLVTEPRHKVDILRRAVHALGVGRALIFMNFQQRLRDAQFKLQARGMESAALHGELPKLARTNIMNDFRRGRLRALVVSDVAARGLDIPDCDAVFHLEMPSSGAHYAHRAGRTGRMGSAAQGIVVSVIAPGERFVVDKLAANLGVPILEAHVAHGKFGLGPPPAGYTFDRDQESDKASEKAPAAEGAEEQQQQKKRSRKDEAPAGAATARGGADEAGTAPAASSSRAPGSSGHAAAAAVATRRGGQPDSKGKDPVGGADVNVEEDSDDDDIRDEDLQAFRQLTRSQLRQMGDKRNAAAATSGAAEASGDDYDGRSTTRGAERSGGYSRSGDRSSSGNSSGSSNDRRAGAPVPPAASGRGLPAGNKSGAVPPGPRAAPQSDVMAELRKELQEIQTERAQLRGPAHQRGGGGHTGGGQRAERRQPPAGQQGDSGSGRDGMSVDEELWRGGDAAQQGQGQGRPQPRGKATKGAAQAP